MSYSFFSAKKLRFALLTTLFLLALSLCFLSPRQNVQAQTQIKINHQREFRGAWIATVKNIDWPSKPGLSASIQQAELIRLLDRLQELNFNAVIFQVRPEADAYYRSNIEPWSQGLTGTQGLDPGYDPLEFAITESHKRNLEFHAWFNPYRAKLLADSYPVASNHIVRTHPQWIRRYKNLWWMDPGLKEVQDRTYNVIIDVVKRYNIDAVHLDDYFYPYPQAQPFPDQDTYRQYRNQGGNLSLGDWRRQNVDTMVQRLAKGIKSVKSHVKFGISPFGIYRPGQPPGVRGLDAYSLLYADAKKWLELGWVDYMAPQLYWTINAPEQSYPALLKWWSNVNPKRHIYAGNALYRLGEGWNTAEIERQVQISRSLPNSLGNIFFSIKSLRDNQKGISTRLRDTYGLPSLPPSMPWIDSTPPRIPTQVQYRNSEISWNADSTQKVRSWVLYQQNGNQWNPIDILDRDTLKIRVSPGTYALSAADRLANESQAVVIPTS